MSAERLISYTEYNKCVKALRASLPKAQWDPESGGYVRHYIYYYPDMEYTELTGDTDMWGESSLQPIKSSFRWDFKRKCWASAAGQAMSGLLDVLQAHVWPLYKYDKATVGPVGRVQLQEDKAAAGDDAKGPALRITNGPDRDQEWWPGKAAARKGMRTGIRVAQQVADVIKTCKEARITLRHWLKGYSYYAHISRKASSATRAVAGPRAGKHRPKRNKSKEHEEEQSFRDVPTFINRSAKMIKEMEAAYKRHFAAPVRRRYRYIHPHTVKVLRALESMRLVPIQTELPVGCVSMRMCTGVDIVCRHTETGTLVLVELKTGYDNYWHRHTPFPMKGPFAAFHDSPFNQHVLQLLFTRLLFESTCNAKGTEKVDTLLLRVGNSGVDAISLPDWARTRSAQFWEWIKTARTAATA